MIILLLSNRHRTTFLNFRSFRRRRRRLRGADFTHKHFTRIPVLDQVYNDYRMFSIYIAVNQCDFFLAPIKINRFGDGSRAVFNGVVGTVLI